MEKLTVSLNDEHELQILRDDKAEQVETIRTTKMGEVGISHATDIQGGSVRASVEWMDDALCAQTNPEVFTPVRGGSTKAAKKVCAVCDVTEQCLQYALDNNEQSGVWGGLSERERRKLRRQQKTSV